MWAVALLAADDPLSRPELIYGVAGLALALLAGAIAISVADRWRKRAAAPAGVGDTDQLTLYRQMYEQGELTDAEYAELRRKLAEKVKAAAPARPAGPDPVTGRPDPAKLAVPEPRPRPAPAPPPEPEPPPTFATDARIIPRAGAPTAPYTPPPEDRPRADGGAGPPDPPPAPGTA